MDLLGSIIGKMERPPVIEKSAAEKERAKKIQENLKKIQEMDKKRLKDFREKIQLRINKFVNDETAKQIEFEPMDKIYRGIIHDIAETYEVELQGISYGIDGEDRHVVIYKKEFLPSNDEIACLKRGEVYDPIKIEQERKLKQEEEAAYRSKKKEQEKPNSNYHDKYKHIIGDESGKSAAQITRPNEQFGCVPSSNKKDKRSIEETLEDMKKKRQKAKEPTTH